MSQSSVCQILYLINQCEQIKEKVTEKDLTNLIIEMDNEGYNLTKVVVSRAGITTPGLNQLLKRLQSYQILSINEQIVTNEHKINSYLNDDCLTLDFLETANYIVLDYFKSKHYLEGLNK